MKTIILFLSILILIKAQNRNPELVQEYDERNSDNSYYFVYETVDKQRREESGGFEEINGVKSYKVRGSYSYTGPDGIFYEIKYESDKDGFKPKGRHIPGTKMKTNLLPIDKPTIKRINPVLVASLAG
uniref:CSON004602 protein n=1 Tax=Culicoides sonorensis TaxID=179676 RepID=A0A336M5U5_CULSO